MKSISCYTVQHPDPATVHVYLDTRDLIALVEKKPPEAAARFDKKLRRGSSQLVFSMHNIMECCAPLVQSRDGSNVMNTLNRLEDLPHLYIAEARIEALELQEGVSAFLEGREYTPVAPPFVPRFDYVVSPFKEPAPRDYIQYGLSHMIYELWSVDRGLLSGYPIHAKRLRASLKSDRNRPDYRDHGANFQNTVRRNLCLYNIAFPGERIGDLSSWIWDKTHRCPAQRLGYEVFQKLLKNLMDTGEESDIPDFAHISCIPYVDVITLDNRMRAYVAQVDQSIGTNFSSKVCRNVDEIEELL